MKKPYRVIHDDKEGHKINIINNEAASFIVSEQYIPQSRKLRKDKHITIGLKMIETTPQLLYLFAKLAYDISLKEYFETEHYLKKDRADEVNKQLKETLTRLDKKVIEFDNEESQLKHNNNVDVRISKLFDIQSVKNKTVKALLKEEGMNFYINDTVDSITNNTILYSATREFVNIYSVISRFLKERGGSVILDKLNNMDLLTFTYAEIGAILEHYGVIDTLEELLTNWERDLMFSTFNPENEE